MSVAALTTSIKKHGAGIVALAIVFYTFLKFFPDMRAEIRGVSADIKSTLVTVTKEFRVELKEQRVEAAQERAMMWEMIQRQRTRAQVDEVSTVGAN